MDSNMFQNKKGFEIAITTVVVIAVLLLAAVVVISFFLTTTGQAFNPIARLLGKGAEDIEKSSQLAEMIFRLVV